MHGPFTGARYCRRVDDRPYIVERPDRLRMRWDRCAVMGLDRTHGPDWALERWKAVRDLIVGWYGDDRPDVECVPDLVENRAGWLDPVQRAMVERQFATWRAMFPKEPGVEVDLDPSGISVTDHDARVELRVRPTFAFTRPDGSRELVRLRTGRHASSVDDAAVFTTGDEGAVCLDALVGAGVAEEVPTPSDAESVVRELIDLAVRPIDRRRDRVAGPWCFNCVSAPRCGQYPVIGPDRVYVSTRSLVASKTQLGNLGTCERRVAWDRLYSVRIDDDPDVIPHVRAVTGTVFHEMAAAAILADEPDSVVDASCRTVAPSEAAEIQRLWDNHLLLWESDGSPSARSTEYPAGITFMVPGVHIDSRGQRSERPVAITMIGIMDVTGRESDGTPMVVEHRTGASTDDGPLELDLYAVSTAEFIRAHTGEWPHDLAIHLHVLGPERPECRRTGFDHAALDLAVARLRTAAETMARWDPDNTLDPSYSVGRWCDNCRHREMCETFR